MKIRLYVLAGFGGGLAIAIGLCLLVHHYNERNQAKETANMLAAETGLLVTVLSAIEQQDTNSVRRLLNIKLTGNLQAMAQWEALLSADGKRIFTAAKVYRSEHPFTLPTFDAPQ